MSNTRDSRRLLYERLIGQTVGGRYEIVSLMGFGGMGAVYEAVQSNMNRRIALKYIPSHDPITAARFEREALTVSQLRHPNTVTVFDFGQTDDGFLYLSMELLNGRTLTDLIKKESPLPPERVVHITSQICRSLAEAHQMGIVHRDIKPDNVILIDVDGDPDVVKVLDFGIAKAVSGEDDVQLTGAGRIVGTPRYMSPEQILSETIDHRSDIYSLGCIIFEMLCGAPPFKASNTTALMLSHASEAPPPFAERLPSASLDHLPLALEQVVRRTLSKSPQERPQTTEALRLELEASLAGAPGVRPVHSGPPQGFGPAPEDYRGAPHLAGPSTSHGSSQSGDTGAAHSRHDQLHPEAEKKSNKALLFALPLLVVLVLVLAAFIIFGDSSREVEEFPGSEELAFVIDPVPSEIAARVPQEPDQVEDAPVIHETIHVRVVTTPPGVSVIEDGEALGTTPLNISVDSETGALFFELRADGYRSREVTLDIDVEPGQTQAFSFELEKVPAPRVRQPPRQASPPRPPPEEPEEVAPVRRTPSVPILDDPGSTPRIDRL